MRNRIQPLTQWISLALGAALLFQGVQMIRRWNPVEGLRTPQAPSWRPAEETAGTKPPVPPAVPTTNPAAASAGATNLAAGSNSLARAGSAATSPATLHPAQPSGATGSPPASAVPQSGASNSPTASLKPTPPPPGMPPGMPPGIAMGMMPPGGPGGPGGRPAKPLPPLAQARIDRIIQSELLAPIFRPPPMALLGIAGYHAFIRTPSGQSSLLREGGESDGIKLLRLGTNRVLIEQAGEKKELTIFSGVGSESLLPKK